MHSFPRNPIPLTFFMASRRIRRVSLFTDIQKAKLENANIITLSDFLSTSFDHLRIILDLGYFTLNSLICDVADIVTPKPTLVCTQSYCFILILFLIFFFIKAWSLLQSQSHFKTSFPVLDDALHGGLPCRTLTEVAGPQAAGKTELVLQWTIYTSLPPAVGGLGKGTLFLDSDGTFSVERFSF